MIDGIAKPLWSLLIQEVDLRWEGSIYKEEYEKAGYDPQREMEVITTRHRFKIDDMLATKDVYAAFIRTFLATDTVDDLIDQ